MLEAVYSYFAILVQIVVDLWSHMERRTSCPLMKDAQDKDQAGDKNSMLASTLYRKVSGYGAW